MSLHRNRVQMTVTGTPGTGAITLNAATTGYQSFASAYGADATVDILITENANWEVCRNCAYTNSTPQVGRGTLEASSAGPTTRVSFGSGAIVSVIATAASGNNWGLNEISASPTGAGVTGVVGTLHLLNIGGLTASRDFTLPATCAVGDRVGVFITTGDDAFELSLKPASGDTINGGSGGAEWSRLFITGECVIFRCITADTDWIVEYDGRIPCQSIVSSNGISMANATIIRLTSAQWTTDKNIGSTYITTGTNPAFKIRRANVYQLSARGSSMQMASTQTWYVRMEKAPNGTPTAAIEGRAHASTADRLSYSISGLSDCAINDEYMVAFVQNTGTTQTSSALGASIMEVL